MQSAENSDSDLIAQIQKRDPDGLAAAYRRYGTSAYSLLYRITRDSTAAEDLTQELFFRVWNRIGHFDPSRGSLGLWIHSIARNLGIDHVRSASAKFNERLLRLDPGLEIALSYKPVAPEALIHNARLVREAFLALSFDQKRVLEMAYFDGMSQSEIAAKLEQPLGTVKSCMRTALIKLRMASKAGDA